MAHGGKQKAEYANTDSPASSPVLSPLDRLVSPSKKTSSISPKTNPNNRATPKKLETEGKDEPAEEKTKEVELAAPSPNFAAEGAEPSPQIEISIARSVSVSKGEKKKVDIPAGAGSGPKTTTTNNDRLAPVSAEARTARADKKTESQMERERIFGKKGKTPKITDAYRGHRHGNSHGVQIETTSLCSRASLSSMDIMCSAAATTTTAATPAC